MKVTKVSVPSNSILSNTDFDFVDCYKGQYSDRDNSIASKDIGKAFFTSAPSWTAALFKLRNKVVSAFGLKIPEQTQNRQEQLNDFECEPGERLGLFQVFGKTENEVILGEDDKHLNFRISLLKGDSPNEAGVKDLTISTTVKFNNGFGKLYFLPVKPFHQIIVPTMLKGIIKQLEEGR